MALVDTHCHLQDKAFDGDRDEVIARSLSALDWMVVIADSLTSSRKALELTSPTRIYAAVGVHPYHPEEMGGAGRDELRALAESSGVVAIGEIGLDYYRHNDAPRATQQAAFHAQLALATELSLPVVIHNRDAGEDTLAILREHDERLPGVIMHCFSGDVAFAQACGERGYYVSFAGNLTYPKAQPLREAAAAVDRERLLVETDSPYLAPQPVRGKRCEPAHVAHTAAALAQVLGMSTDEAAHLTGENARRVFLRA